MYLGKAKKAEAEKYVINYEMLWEIIEEMTLLNFDLLRFKQLQVVAKKCESPVQGMYCFMEHGGPLDAFRIGS